MNTRQILSCGSGYTRNCITDAYIKTVGARSLRAHLESVKTSVQGRGIYLYVKRKKNEMLHNTYTCIHTDPCLQFCIRFYVKYP